jgi:phosphatidylserine decarboxylase
MKLADRRGNIEECSSGQDRLLEWIYTHETGRFLMKGLINPHISEIGAAFLDSRASRVLIAWFIRKNKIPMYQYEQKKYRSFNEFFKRKALPGARRIIREPERLISPCDGRLSVYKIEENSRFQIKHTSYSTESLLKNEGLAKRYAGGYAWVFRLCVEDYHRYIYVDDGVKSENVKIPGVLHTVNPVANDSFPIYKENAREFSLLCSENFGTVLMMEVGAMMVGKIENRHQARVRRGQEKGNFAFGGSTIILLTQKGKAMPDPDIWENSLNGIETKVRLGESVGRGKKR